MLHIMSVSDMVALALGIPAIILAWRHIRDLKHHGRQLLDITRSLSTRYLGPFPTFIPAITELLRSAPDGASLLVACDLPNYGHISSRRAWARYRGALLEAASTTTLKIVLLSESRRDRVLEEQFRISEEDWVRWKNARARRATLDEFVGNERAGDDVDTLSFARFKALLNRADRRSLNELSPAEVLESDETLPIYLWIVDDRCAVFAIPSFADDATTEHGFTTSDARLVRALRDVHKRIADRARPVKVVSEKEVAHFSS
jgi:hypothetical protein